MATATFRTGREIPLNGFGTWKAESGEGASALRHALDAGYRHIDCAPVYMNEKEIGEVFAEYLQGDSPKLNRSDLFITSKVWNSCHAPDKVVEACKQSLKDLQLDYVDLYLVHHPFAWEFNGLPIDDDSWVKRDEAGAIVWGKGVSLENTWRGMERCVDDGLVRDIGVSNYSVALICDLMQYARIPPVVNQCEAHVCNTRQELREVCAMFGIHFTMYSVLGSGKEGPMNEQVVRDIAEKVEASPAQVLIAWGLARKCSVLAKSTNPDRIRANLAAEKVQLGTDDLTKLDKLDRKLMVCNMVEYWEFPSHA